jgi:hypothetical protein
MGPQNTFKKKKFNNYFSYLLFGSLKNIFFFFTLFPGVTFIYFSLKMEQTKHKPSYGSQESINKEKFQKYSKNHF